MDYYLKAASIHEFKGTKNPSVEYLSQGQLKLLFSIPDTKTRLGRRNRFLMILSYETGMRMNELLNLRLCDILESDNETRIRIHGKGNKIRYIPLLSGAEAHLQAYLKEFHPHKNEQDYLFYTIHNGFKTQMKSGTVDALLKKYAKKATQTDPKFPLNLHEHMLRHSIAMTMYKKGIPISYIRDFLGHSSIESTQIYAYADEETIRKTLESVSTILDKNKPAPQKIWKGKEESLLEFCGLV